MCKVEGCDGLPCVYKDSPSTQLANLIQELPSITDHAARLVYIESCLNYMQKLENIALACSNKKYLMGEINRARSTLTQILSQQTP